MYKISKTLEEIRALFNGKKIVSASEIVATGLVRSDATLTHWRSNGEGPPCLKLSAGKYLYPVEGLISWLESCIIKTSSQPTEKEPPSAPMNNGVPDET